MGWMKKEEGWTKRANELIRCLNEGESYEEMEKYLDDDEKEWYKTRLEMLNEENAKMLAAWRKNGIPYEEGERPIQYDLIEDEW